MGHERFRAGLLVISEVLVLETLRVQLPIIGKSKVQKTVNIQSTSLTLEDTSRALVNSNPGDILKFQPIKWGNYFSRAKA